MKKALIAFGMLLMTAGAANAGGLVTKHASSVQLTVDAARTTATRIGSSFSISGSNIDTTDGTTAEQFLLALSLLVYTVLHCCSNTRHCWGSISFSQSYTQADAVPTSAPTVGEAPNFSSLTSTQLELPVFCRYCNQCRCTTVTAVLVARRQTICQ